MSELNNLIINITFSISDSILNKWENWFTSSFLPKLDQKNDLIISYRYLNIKNATQEAEESRCIQIEFKTHKDVMLFYREIFPTIERELKANFSDKCLYYGSLLELISQKTNF